jgi:uncharacterized protein involved in exopolysaccharide biosynthesis
MIDVTAGRFAHLTAREIALVALRRRLVLGGAALLPLLSAVAALHLATPRYRADASVMIKTGREYLAREDGQVAGQSAPQTTKQEAVNSELEIMTSRAVIEPVIARIGIGRLYPALLHSTPSHGSAMDAAVALFGRRLKVEAVKISNVVDISFTDPDRAMAARALGEFLRVYNERHLAVFSGGQSSAVYADAVRSDLADLDALERQRASIRLAGGIFDAGAQRLSLIARRADSDDRHRRLLDRQASLRERVAFLQSALDGMAGTQVSTETDKSDTDAAPGAALVELERTRSDLLARYRADNPLVRAVDAQLAGVAGVRAAMSRPFVHVRTERSPVGQAVVQELVLDRAELAPLEGGIARAADETRVDQAELRRIEAGDTVLRGLASRIDSLEANLREERTQYEKARALDAMDALKALSVSIIEPPTAAGVPVSPRPAMFALAGLMAGALSASGLLLLLVLIEDRVLTQAGLERASGLKVLGSFADLGAG